MLTEFLPLPENRVTLADELDANGMPVAHFNYSQCENDKALTGFAKRILREIWDGADAQDTLTIDRYAHLVGGARMGFTPAIRSSTRTSESGMSRIFSSSMAR